ncbi:MAG: SDR family oxidoreductase [Chloroflexota bacterium]|nr:SDR family oxidoreductase [Chloroflexota bacterium]
MELKDSVAIVTGGARGIGRGIAFELAKEGARIVIADLPSVAADRDETIADIKLLGSEAIAVDVDVRDYVQCQAMVQAAIDRWGQVDILVNNAGVISVGFVAGLSEEAWDLVMDVNVKGTFLCSKAVAAHMMQRRSGRIINLSSQAGKSGKPGVSHYCASKFAVIGFTQALAGEMAPFDVTVNAICPGEVDSYMWREVLIPAVAAGRGISTDEAWEEVSQKQVPLGRPQTASDMGHAVVFLCKAGNITGESINISGGTEMH